MQRTLTREALADAFSAGVGSAELVGIEVENGLVDQVTARGLFASSVESQDGGAKILVLRSIPPQ